MNFHDPIEREYEINREYELPLTPLGLIGRMDSIEFKIKDPNLRSLIDLKFENGDKRKEKNIFSCDKIISRFDILSISQLSEDKVKDVQILTESYMYIRKTINSEEDYLTLYRINRKNKSSNISNIKLVQSFRVKSYRHIGVKEVPKKELKESDSSILSFKTKFKSISNYLKANHQREFLIVGNLKEGKGQGKLQSILLLLKLKEYKSNVQTNKNKHKFVTLETSVINYKIDAITSFSKKREVTQSNHAIIYGLVTNQTQSQNSTTQMIAQITLFRNPFRLRLEFMMRENNNTQKILTINELTERIKKTSQGQEFGFLNQTRCLGISIKNKGNFQDDYMGLDEKKVYFKYHCESKNITEPLKVKIFQITHFFLNKDDKKDQIQNFVYFNFTKDNETVNYTNRIFKTKGPYNYIFDPYIHGLVKYSETADENVLVELSQIEGIQPSNRKSFQFIAIDTILVLIAETNTMKKNQGGYIFKTKIFMFRQIDIERSIYEPYIETHIDLKENSILDGIPLVILDKTKDEVTICSLSHYKDPQNRRRKPCIIISMAFAKAKLVLKPGLDPSKVYEIVIDLYGVSSTYSPKSLPVSGGVAKQAIRGKFEEKLITFNITLLAEETIQLRQDRIPSVKPGKIMNLDKLITIQGSYGSILIDQPSSKIQYGNRLELEYYFYGFSLAQKILLSREYTFSKLKKQSYLPTQKTTNSIVKGSSSVVNQELNSYESTFAHSSNKINVGDFCAFEKDAVFIAGKILWMTKLGDPKFDSSGASQDTRTTKIKDFSNCVGGGRIKQIYLSRFHKNSQFILGSCVYAVKPKKSEIYIFNYSPISRLKIKSLYQVALNLTHFYEDRQSIKISYLSPKDQQIYNIDCFVLIYTRKVFLAAQLQISKDERSQCQKYPWECDHKPTMNISWYSDTPPFLTKKDDWKDYINDFNFLEPFYFPYNDKKVILGLIYHEFNNLCIKGKVKNVMENQDMTTFSTEPLYFDIDAKFINCGESRITKEK